MPAGPIDVGNAGTLLRLLPGWLAAQEGRSFTLDGDESIRRRPVDRVAEPLRFMGALDRRARRTLCAVHDSRCAPALDRLRAAGRLGPGQVVRALGGAGGRRRHDRGRAGTQPRSHRAHAAPCRSQHPPQRQARDGRQRRRAGARPRDRAERSELSRVCDRRGRARPRLTPARTRRRRQLDAHRVPANRAAHARDRARRPGGRKRRADRRGADLRPRRGPWGAGGHDSSNQTRCHWR